jgi:glyoxylase-like metal-dependent hydrolase (beta-lactamase superfamily II)
MVIATHVHLDHAGGVGLLMQELPRARLIAHPRGARHLVDPARLVRSATAVYGPEEMERSYGTLVHVGADRVLKTADGMTLELAGRPLVFLDTPGHAMHHHCIWDERSRSFFTGDTFGLSYREFDTDRGAFILPTTTPVQFEPDALKRSVARMLERNPDCMYLTHFGRVGEAAALARLLIDQADEMVALGRAHAHSGEKRHALLKQALAALYARRLRDMNSPLDDATIHELLAMDIELNAQGLGIWLDRSAR